MCVPWESNPHTLHCWRNALPLSHRNTCNFPSLWHKIHSVTRLHLSNNMNSLITKICLKKAYLDMFTCYFQVKNIIIQKTKQNSKRQWFATIYFPVHSSCGSVVEHCVSGAKVVGSIPREHTYWQKMYNLNVLYKSLWIKASGKCILMLLRLFSVLSSVSTASSYKFMNDLKIFTSTCISYDIGLEHYDAHNDFL